MLRLLTSIALLFILLGGVDTQEELSGVTIPDVDDFTIESSQ